jgi:hypothetical protein
MAAPLVTVIWPPDSKAALLDALAGLLTLSFSVKPVPIPRAAPLVAIAPSSNSSRSKGSDDVHDEEPAPDVNPAAQGVQLVLAGTGANVLAGHATAAA